MTTMPAEQAAMTAQPRSSAARRPPAVLSIAGSDSGGGAGIQADLKAFAACGVHGLTAITAITAQSTVAVDAIEPVSPAMILAQVRSVAADIGVDAVKVGMLGTVATIEAVALALEELGPTVPVVIDPVMVSESGARLLAADARQRLIELLLPRATVLTPNVAEAVALVDGAIAADAASDLGARQAQAADDAIGTGLADDDLRALARQIHALGPRVVVVTGGHRDQATDLLHDGRDFVEITGPRYRDGAAHGSGCTHSAALAAHLAHGLSALEAARGAKLVAAAAVRDGLRAIGAGAGPVDALQVTRRGPVVEARSGTSGGAIIGAG